jgi:hypothetical protein
MYDRRDNKSSAHIALNQISPKSHNSLMLDSNLPMPGLQHE